MNTSPEYGCHPSLSGGLAAKSHMTEGHNFIAQNPVNQVVRWRRTTCPPAPGWQTLLSWHPEHFSHSGNACGLTAMTSLCQRPLVPELITQTRRTRLIPLMAPVCRKEGAQPWRKGPPQFSHLFRCCRTVYQPFQEIKSCAGAGHLGHESREAWCQVTV